MTLEEVLNKYGLQADEYGWVSGQFCGRIIVITIIKTKRTKVPISYDIDLHGYNAGENCIKGKLRSISSIPANEFTAESLSRAMEAARRAANTNTRRNHNRRRT